MAESTTTRKTLRRAIAAELQMPFFRRYPAGESTIDTGSTASKIIDAGLTQRQDYWNGHWFYGLVAGDQSIIRANIAAERSFQLEIPMAATPTAGDKYEIHTIWNAFDIHTAINRALAIAARSFPETIVDTTQVFCEDKMEYDLTALTKKPFILTRVYAEKPSVLLRGTASGGAVTYLSTTEAQSTLTDVAAGWLISIYAGTGMNQVRTVSSVSAVTINGVYVSTSIYPTVDFTAAPDNTSKYALWNPNKQRYDWNRLDIFYTDSDEFPDALRLRTRMPYYYGMRMRIEYLFANTELTSDTGTTIIPQEYLIPKACAILHGQKLNDTKADRDLHFGEHKRYEDIAAAYLLNNAPRMPATTIPASDSEVYMDNENPLGWPGMGGEGPY